VLNNKEMESMSNPSLEMAFPPFAHRMQTEGLPEIVIQTFKHYYSQLLEGHTGFIPESAIQPVQALPHAGTFSNPLHEVGEGALPHTVVIKLNGGLGTSMGLEQAKSLLRVKGGLSFLDIIAKQATHAGAPLVLMNSFATQAASLAGLKSHPALWKKDIPLDFLQHKILKVNQADFSPAEYPDDPDLAWCPPGHGDIYTALVTRGMLARLLSAGYRYAFVSNSDNLGAVLDAGILGFFIENELPFLMEVAERTSADRKGGHLAMTPAGHLLLRESAQCPPEDQRAFQDITRHRYFNTNNVWINLPALKRVMDARNQILGLPLIRNAKTLNPRDRHSTPVYQLETAMGAAIAVFEGAQAVQVPRSRFAPVKTAEQLLAVRSDAFALTDDFRVVNHPKRQSAPNIELDARFYTLVDEMEARFPFGPPSLLHCDHLSVVGDVKFGRGVVVKGTVNLENPAPAQMTIPDGTVLAG